MKSDDSRVAADLVVGQKPITKGYMADLDPNDCGLMSFTITYSGNENDDQPWQIDCDAVSDTHQTLDELLFWNLVMGERFISENLRQKINTEWEATRTP